MRNTPPAVICIAAMIFPSFAALGQSPGARSTIGTVTESLALVHAGWRPNARLTAKFDATIQSGIRISRRGAPAEPYDSHFITRLGLGVLGFASGAFIGYQTGRMLRPCDQCYLGGSGEMIIGTIGGGLAGTSFLAIPSFGSPCTSASRIGRALAGGGIGYLLGLVVIVPSHEGATPFAGPGVALTTALGGLLVQGRC